jgi:hypothetical protein
VVGAGAALAGVAAVAAAPAGTGGTGDGVAAGAEALAAASVGDGVPLRGAMMAVDARGPTMTAVAAGPRALLCEPPQARQSTVAARGSVSFLNKRAGTSR